MTQSLVFHPASEAVHRIMLSPSNLSESFAVIFILCKLFSILFYMILELNVEIRYELHSHRTVAIINK